MNKLDQFEGIDLDEMDEVSSFDMSHKTVIVEEDFEDVEPVVDVLEVKASKARTNPKKVGVGVSEELETLYKQYITLRFPSKANERLTGAVLKKLVKYGIDNCRVRDFPKVAVKETLVFVGTAELEKAFEASNAELFPFSTTIKAHHHAYAIEALKLLIRKEKGSV